ncbi:cytochrome c oxidase subunit II [Thermaerobacter sp. FW80]|uniref:cytochrome c oxidase subunit II n=1 Tax=Thermaerobacter sp. FW80 TaxID=2546351 RepID=UPI001074B45E|nr:cytochrome c oxidase subunit II [Thermaerobacter sp. FW80]QBS37400.1 cytochrome c oxidase subunit II [Thermaerobacter sp. FW80]
MHQVTERDNRRGGAIMTLLVGLVLVAGVASTVYATKRWWLPPLVSAAAAPIDHMFNLLMVTIGIVFVLTQGALAWFVWQAARNPRALYWHENRRLETTWTVVTAVVLTAFIVMGYQIWLSLHAPTAAAAEKTAVVEVWGQQFFWTARYPGPDGQFGKTDPQYVDFQKNPFGIDPNDPAGRDDIVVDGSKEPIVVPAGYRVTVRLASRDVIHSFFVPSLRVKMDAVPGQVNEVYVEPTEPGTYEIACAELCGVGHFAMRGELRVVSEADWQAWLQERAGEHGGTAQ